MKEKLIQLISKSINTVKTTLVILDGKTTVLIPNPKLKKMLYIGVGSFFGFMILIILLGLIFSPFNKSNNKLETVLNKPKIINVSPPPQEELSETEKEILKLETSIKELIFPESILNIPLIERDIKI